MRCRATRGGRALGLAAVLLAIAGCAESEPREQRSSAPEVGFVETTQIDRSGAEVTAAPGGDPADPEGDGAAVCPPVSIAVAADLSGPATAPGVGIENGVQLAVDKHNAANPRCQVQLKPFDTEGDVQRAAPLAAEIVDDVYTIGLVGPAVSAVAEATGDVFDGEGLVTITPSASSATLSDNGWRTFFRGSANDSAQGEAIANYLTGQLGHRAVCVVDDSTQDGLGLAQAVRVTLGAAADSACNITVQDDERDFGAVVNQITNAAADSVFFSGSPEQSAALVQQLRDAGYPGLFAGADRAVNRTFIDEAGGAAKDAVLGCRCGPAPAKFVDEYTAAFGEPPGPFSAEGYDLGTVLLKGIDSGAITRPALLEFVTGYAGPGLARRYAWTNTGELEDPSIWIYSVE